MMYESNVVTLRPDLCTLAGETEPLSLEMVGFLQNLLLSNRVKFC